MRRAILGFRPHAQRVLTFATQAIRVERIFHQIPPAPPPSLLSSLTTLPFPSSPPDSCTHWEEDIIAHRKLFRCLRFLHTGVSYNRNRSVEWPVESANPSSLSPADYMNALICPVTNLINQLHDPRVLKNDVVGCAKVDLGHSIVGVSFTTKVYKKRSLSSPYILFVPDDLFELDGRTCSPGLKFALSNISESAASVVVTNFKDIAVFFPRNKGYFPTEKDVFIKVPTSQIPATLRILSTACLLESLPPLGFMKYPDLLFPEEFDRDYMFPIGPPQNPDEPLHPDEHLIATCRRNSEFDHPTLIRNRDRALQFFRWNKHMLQHKSKLIAQVNSTLHGITNQRFNPGVDIAPPLYPFNPSEIPLDTKNHLQTIYRDSPLAQGGLDKVLAQSESFTLRIQDMLAEGEKKGFCTVYRCQLASIDGRPVSASPSLCLKLFDDRFQDLHDSINYEETIPESWFKAVFFAEDFANNEMAAYNKLCSVQGTVIPWFYGQHQFTLPDGTVVQGLLMEYIDGYQLDSKRVTELTPAQQIQVIQSSRHAVRILDIGDISQMDWHDGQLLLYSHPTAHVECVVLIDFAMALQTMQSDFVNFLQNCWKMMSVLLHAGPPDGGLDSDLIFQYYDDPDKWDPTTASLIDKKGRRKWIEYRGTLFPFIKLEPPPPSPMTYNWIDNKLVVSGL